MLLPADFLPRRADAVQTVGAALLASATGQGHRRIASALDLPADTVRGWLRRAGRRAEWLRVLATRFAYQADANLGPFLPRGSALADAVEALGQAAAVASRRLGITASPWQVIAALTRGQLLAPPRRSG